MNEYLQKHSPEKLKQTLNTHFNNVQFIKL